MSSVGQAGVTSWILFDFPVLPSLSHQIELTDTCLHNHWWLMSLMSPRMEYTFLGAAPPTACFDKIHEQDILTVFNGCVQWTLKASPNKMMMMMGSGFLSGLQRYWNLHSNVTVFSGCKLPTSKTDKKPSQTTATKERNGWVGFTQYKIWEI